MGRFKVTVVGALGIEGLGKQPPGLAEVGDTGLEFLGGLIHGRCSWVLRRQGPPCPIDVNGRWRRCEVCP